MTNIIFHDPCSPTSAEEVGEFERFLGISLPSDYKAFLLSHNGGAPKPCYFPIQGDSADDYGILRRFLCLQEGTSNDLRSYIKTYDGRIPKQFLPIGYDPGGNLICMVISGANTGYIYFWDHEEESEEGESPTYDNLYLIANSFTDLLNSFKESLE